MYDYHFTMVVGGTGCVDRDMDVLREQCVDGVVHSYGQCFYVRFSVLAQSAYKAISTAIHQVKMADCSVLAINEAGAVTAKDIAEMSGMTAPTVRAYARGERAGVPFPPPVSFGVKPLWCWPTVSEWLHYNNKLDRQKMELAQVALRMTQKGEFQRPLRKCGYNSKAVDRVLADTEVPEM